jgi:hypothetical protein
MMSTNGSRFHVAHPVADPQNFSARLSNEESDIDWERTTHDSECRESDPKKMLYDAMVWLLLLIVSTKCGQKV